MSRSSLRLLYIADPNGSHNIQWMTSAGRDSVRYLLVNQVLQGYSSVQMEDWAQGHGLVYLGSLENFSILRFWRTLQQFLILRTRVKAEKIDLIHILFAEPDALWAVFRRALGVPFVVTTRGTDVLQTIPRFFAKRDPLSWLVSRLYKLAFRSVDAITSTSTAQVSAVQRIVSGLEHKCSIVRTGLDLSQVAQESRNPLKWPIEGEYIFFPRMMKPLYRHELALEAIAQLPSWVLERYTFVFVDRDGPQKEYIQKIETLIEASPAKTVFLDLLPPSTLHAAIRAAALTVMTPQSDGSSVTAAAALFLRCPLILPPLDYDAELFRRGAFFFEDWTPESLASKMLEVLGGSWQERLEAGFEDVSRHFDREKEMSRLWEIYGSLVPSSSEP